MTIPLFKPKIYPEAIANVTRVLSSPWIGLGPETAKFEEEFASYIGCKYAIGMNSGTEALRIAVASLNIPHAGYIISTPNTFVSTNHVIVQGGYTPLFADIDLDSGSLSPDTILPLLKRYGDQVGAIMLVHFGGMPADLDEIIGLCQDYNLPLIQDSAHACGATYFGQRIGSEGLNCFSLHAVKALTSGEGGMLTTNDERIRDFSKKMRWLGIDKSTLERSKDSYSWEYDVPLLGFKSHMSDINAAIGRGQLLYLHEDVLTRSVIVEHYRSRLEDQAGITLLSDKSDRTSSNHLFVIRFENKEMKERVMAALKANDIQFGYHYKPNYYYPVYTSLPTFQHTSCPNMETWYQTALSLPLYIDLDAEEVEHICDVILEAI